MGENDRPQDVGRSHSRRPRRSSSSVEILERYRAALVGELATLLDELAPAPAEQLTVDGTPGPTVGLGLAARRERWDLAIKVAKAIAEQPESDPDPTPRAAPAAARARGAPRLTAAQRRSIG